MRLRLWMASCLGAAVVACASAPPPPPADAHEAEDEPREAAKPEQEPLVTVDAANLPERTRAPSTASYEAAMAAPESLDIRDEHAHLSDAQLTAPMRGVSGGCRVPPNARVTIHTAVQDGRAIGVTVDVRLVKAKSRSRRPPSKAAVRAEAKALATITSCIDHNVRAVVWPPSRRRDSFTTEL